MKGTIDMGITKKYNCCLCQTPLAVESLYGIQFKTTGFEECDAVSSERHLCYACLHSAADMAKKIQEDKQAASNALGSTDRGDNGLHGDGH